MYYNFRHQIENGPLVQIPCSVRTSIKDSLDNAWIGAFVTHFWVLIDLHCDMWPGYETWNGKWNRGYYSDPMLSATLLGSVRNHGNVNLVMGSHTVLYIVPVVTICIHIKSKVVYWNVYTFTHVWYCVCFVYKQFNTVLSHRSIDILLTYLT